MEQIITDAEHLRAKLQGAIQEDIEAFEAVMRAHRLPDETTEEKDARASTIEQATLHAAAVPFEVCHLALGTLKLAVQVAQEGNLNAASDAGTAGALAIAALRGAGANVRINLIDLAELDQARAWLEELERIEAEASALDHDLKSALLKRASISTQL